MPRQRRQNGWVKPTGKQPRTWTGYWYAYEVVDGREIRRQKTRVLGLRNELTKGDAEEKLRDLIRADTKSFRPNSQADLIFEVAARNYLQLKKGDWGPKTRSCLHSIFERHIIPAIGAKHVAGIKPSDVKAFLNDVAEAGSESLVRKTLTHIRAIFEMLVEDEVISRNPAKSKSVIKPKTRRPNERYLELTECRNLLAAAKGRDHLILRILLSCALRPSEVFALRVHDVLNGKLRIDEAAVPGLAIKETKTEESDGCVPISPTLEAQLRAYIGDQHLSNGRDLLFSSRVGTAINHENYLDRVLKKIAKQAGIPGVNFQVLRRTAATHMQNFGPVKSAQAILRHADASTTLRHYQKVIDESVVRTAEGWDAALTQGMLQ